MDVGGVEVPTRYVVALAATLAALLVLAVAGGGDGDRAAAPSSTSTTVTTAVTSDRSPISIRPLPSTSIVVRPGWMRKGTSRYADRSDDRSSSVTLTTLPASTTSLPESRPAAVGSGASDGGG